MRVSVYIENGMFTAASLRWLRNCLAEEGLEACLTILDGETQRPDGVPRSFDGNGQALPPDAVLYIVRAGMLRAAAQALCAFPLGLPKMILADASISVCNRIIAQADITFVEAALDHEGNLDQRQAKCVVALLAGMASAGKKQLAMEPSGSDASLIGLTMFGVTTKGVTRVREILESKGFEVIVFHATGVGGDTMEYMVYSDMIDGVIDYTPAEITGTIMERSNSSKNRLQAAVKKGIPLVVVPGALDVLIFTESGGVPEKYNDPARKFIVHSPTNTCGRALTEELLQAADYITAQLNQAKGPAALILPLCGIDSFNTPDGPWPDMEPVKQVFETLRANVQPHIRLEEISAHINDDAFAEHTANVFLQLWEAHKQKN